MVGAKEYLWGYIVGSSHTGITCNTALGANLHWFTFLPAIDLVLPVHQTHTRKPKIRQLDVPILPYQQIIRLGR